MANKKEEAKVNVSLSIIDIQKTAFKYNAEYDGYSQLSRGSLRLVFNKKLIPNYVESFLDDFQD
ncbi:MAG: hypothetical protein ACK5KV_10720 [Bacteroides graminisolvens]|jgi:hypothetical protein|uniref:hypothetical protein n=1 Tax=Bacteroides graminisolvens TaxID=477666 RepID=UPI003A89BFD3